jgi:putative ABC transport system ATP-binding protein
MSQNIIEINDVSKIYHLGGEVVKALDGISLNVEKGEFVAIIGPSGSGKSTLMNIIGCLDVPTKGEYTLDGKSINDYNDNGLAKVRNEKIGFIFQQFNLLNRLTALENVELPLVYQGIEAKERRQIAMDCLKRVGLENRYTHYPNQLSGGQQQRVAIARALASRPSILLADEPTGALDSKTGKEVIEMIKEINREGQTVILITHDLNVAQSARRQIVLADGKIVEQGGEV